MKKRYRPEEEDDGRTIANMNVEGMPWYVVGDEKRAEKSRLCSAICTLAPPAIALMLFVLCYIKLLGSTFNPFIYFRF